MGALVSSYFDNPEDSFQEFSVHRQTMVILLPLRHRRTRQDAHAYGFLILNRVIRDASVVGFSLKCAVVTVDSMDVRD